MGIISSCRIRTELKENKTAINFGRPAFFTGLMSLARILVLTIFIPVLVIPAHAEQGDARKSHVVSLATTAEGALLKATKKALFRSIDEGKTWMPIKLPTTVSTQEITAVSAAAKNKNVWYLAGLKFGVLRTKDGGINWVKRNTDRPIGNVIAIAAHADLTDTVYVYVEGKGFYRSQDAGAHWRLMDKGPRDKVSQFTHTNMPGSMQTGWLFAATNKGVARSMDCFCGWQNAGALSSRILAISYNPLDPSHVYALTEKDMLVSLNGGEHWAHVKLPHAGLTTLHAAAKGWLYVVGAHSLFRSHDEGITWESINDAS